MEHEKDFRFPNHPFPGWKEPRPMTKKEIEEIIEEFKKRPDMFKKDTPRWNSY